MFVVSILTAASSGGKIDSRRGIDKDFRVECNKFDL